MFPFQKYISKTSQLQQGLTVNCVVGRQLLSGISNYARDDEGCAVNCDFLRWTIRLLTDLVVI